jgi:hypothetical protein
MAYANEASRLATTNADKYAAEKKARAEKAAKAKENASDSRSTTDTAESASNDSSEKKS